MSAKCTLNIMQNIKHQFADLWCDILSIREYCGIKMPIENISSHKVDTDNQKDYFLEETFNSSETGFLELRITWLDFRPSHCHFLACTLLVFSPELFPDQREILHKFSRPVLYLGHYGHDSEVHHHFMYCFRIHY